MKTHCILALVTGKLTLVGHAPDAPEAPKSFAGDATSRTFIFTKVKAQ